MLALPGAAAGRGGYRPSPYSKSWRQSVTDVLIQGVTHVLILNSFSPDITALPTCSSFRTEQADFFFPFTPVKGSACAERNLSALSSPHPATFISAIPSLPSKTAPNLIHPQRAPDPPLPVILNPSDKDG